MRRICDFEAQVQYVVGVASPNRYRAFQLAMRACIGAMFAMTTLSLAPVFIIFFIFQRYIVDGISTSGLKS
jgi:ABC-type glycerol-3-phosphate transport system permease component